METWRFVIGMLNGSEICEDAVDWYEWRNLCYEMDQIAQANMHLMDMYFSRRLWS